MWRWGREAGIGILISKRAWALIEMRGRVGDDRESQLGRMV